ncbi:MAG TPA: hypothetical protein VMC85_13195, partial [Desulfomonilaceae bacterium]|nr:hypothetical protein [Desulfomonilaceae bacterium]
LAPHTAGIGTPPRASAGDSGRSEAHKRLAVRAQHTARPARRQQAASRHEDHQGTAKALDNKQVTSADQDASDRKKVLSSVCRASGEGGKTFQQA